MLKKRPPEYPFDIRDGRAMVSLGPLSQKRFCPYNCPFCYVHSDFMSFGSLSPLETVTWLLPRRQDFDIVYISGDTDSFAHPRTSQGIELLQRLIDLDVDILFTTRAVFNSHDINRLSNVVVEQTKNGKQLFGCVSVAQLRHPHLEPKPMAPPLERIEQLQTFKNIGMVSVLAMRPFLPVVPVDEYIEILERARSSIHIALGEAWYADVDGLLERQVFQGRPTPPSVVFSKGNMTFDINTKVWKIYDPEAVRDAVADYSRRHNLPFFMRSRPAILWAREMLKPQ
jgi:hypothetical protein